MNNTSLESFLTHLPFSSPDYYLEVLRLAMAERNFDRVPESLPELLYTSGGKIRHPGLAAENLWVTFCMDCSRFILSAEDFTAEAMRDYGIRLFDPVRWADEVGESIVIPLHYSGGDIYTDDSRRILVEHHNGAAGMPYTRKVGESFANSYFFRPVCDREVIDQLAKMINFCSRRWLMITRARRFAVPDPNEAGRTGEREVNIFAIKLSYDENDDLCQFCNVFSGMLPPGEYDLNDEETFELPEYDKQEEFLSFSGYIDYNSGDGLRYLY